MDTGSRLLQWCVVVALLCFCMVPARSVAQTAAGDPQLGVGLGIPYGGVGMNIELNPMLPGGAQAAANYYSVNFGVGYSYAGPGYTFGLKVYPAGRENALQPRLSVYYGVVGYVEYSGWYSYSDTFTGVAAGAGTAVRLNPDFSIDADLMYIVHTFSTEMGDASRVKISAGIRYHF